MKRKALVGTGTIRTKSTSKLQ